jgi:cytochrome c oxidase subunit I+III
LEWANKAPVPPFNVRSIPRIESRHPLWDQPGLQERIQNGHEYLASAPEGRREVLVSTVVGAVPEYVNRLPHPTWIPLWAALFTSIIFVGTLLSQYTVAVVGIAALFVTVLVWWWEGAPLEKLEKNVGLGIRLPIELGDSRSTGWLGGIVFLFVDAAVFASLVYVYFYLWTASDLWPPVGFRPNAGTPEWGAVVLLAMLAPAAILAHVGIAAGRLLPAVAGLLLVAALTGGLLYFEILALQRFPFDIQAHAYAGVVAGLMFWHVLHAALVFVTALFSVARVAARGARAERSLATRRSALFWYYLVGKGAMVMGILDWVR